MFGKKKEASQQQQQQQQSRGQQANNQPRNYTPPSHQGHALPGHAGFLTYKLRGTNAMPDIRFNYVRPDGKPYSGPGRNAK